MSTGVPPKETLVRDYPYPSGPVDPSSKVSRKLRVERLVGDDPQETQKSGSE